MNKTTVRSIIALQIFGFLIVVCVIWLDEMLDLPHLLFNSPQTPLRIGECVFETSAVVLLCVAVTAATLLLDKRLKKLESFLRICAWCKKINVGDEWVSLERYLDGFRKTTISHGMCPDCYKQFKAEQFESPRT